MTYFDLSQVRCRQGPLSKLIINDCRMFIPVSNSIKIIKIDQETREV